MTKSELTNIAKFITLPDGWKVLRVWPAHRGSKQVSDIDSIIFGYPIRDKMSDSFRAYAGKRNAVLRQLNSTSLRERGTPKWDEFGGGYGGGKWYELEFGREVR